MSRFDGDHANYRFDRAFGRSYLIGPRRAPVVIEYIRYTIPEDTRDGFEAAHARAADALRESPYCLSYELSRCEEDPSAYVLRIQWESRSAHLVAVRRGPHVGRFFEAIEPYVSAIQEMRRYQVTRVAAVCSPLPMGHAKDQVRP